MTHHRRMLAKRHDRARRGNRAIYSHLDLEFLAKIQAEGVQLFGTQPVAVARHLAAQRGDTGILAAMRAAELTRGVGTKRNPDREPATGRVLWQSRRKDDKSGQTYTKGRFGPIGCKVTEAHRQRLAEKRAGLPPR